MPAIMPSTNKPLLQQLDITRMTMPRAAAFLFLLRAAARRVASGLLHIVRVLALVASSSIGGVGSARRVLSARGDCMIHAAHALSCATSAPSHHVMQSNVGGKCSKNARKPCYVFNLRFIPSSSSKVSAHYGA